MPTIRWDQGRGDYFTLEALQGFCKAIVAVQLQQPKNISAFKRQLDEYLRAGEGISINGKKLKFLPESYSVWRNYGRIYRTTYLAYETSSSLSLTSLGELLLTLDQTNAADRKFFFSLIASRFRWPHPAFQDYDPSVSPLYPVQIAVKLCAEYREGIDLHQLYRLLTLEHNLTGLEEPAAIRKTFDRYQDGGQEDSSSPQFRQFRELFHFFSQDGALFEIKSDKLAFHHGVSVVDALKFAAEDPTNGVAPVPDRDKEIVARAKLAGARSTKTAPIGLDEPKTLTIHKRAVRSAGRRRITRTVGTGAERPTPVPRTSTYSNFNELEAERLVHELLTEAAGPAKVLWFARSAMEGAAYETLDTPGADGRLFARTPELPDGYHEVKSKSRSQSGFSFTRNEIKRILECSRKGIGYHVWEVSFPNEEPPRLTLIENVQNTFPVGSPRYEAMRQLFDEDWCGRSCELDL